MDAASISASATDSGSQLLATFETVNQLLLAGLPCPAVVAVADKSSFSLSETRVPSSRAIQADGGGAAAVSQPKHDNFVCLYGVPARRKHHSTSTSSLVNEMSASPQPSSRAQEEAQPELLFALSWQPIQ